MITPTIRSIGAPPARHADRVVAEMLRLIVKARINRIGFIRETLGATPDGNPRAQSKLMKKLTEAGRPFVLHTALKPGKRGRYVFKLFVVDGWDAERKAPIGPDDKMPAKPWLAVTDRSCTSLGNRAYEMDASYSLFVTHHALSRLAQRCVDLKGPVQLLSAVNNIWVAYMVEGLDRKNWDWVKDDYRLKFKVSEGRSAFAVLKRYPDGDGGVGIIISTILDTI